MQGMTTLYKILVALHPSLIIGGYSKITSPGGGGGSMTIVVGQPRIRVITGGTPRR